MDTFVWHIHSNPYLLANDSPLLRDVAIHKFDMALKNGAEITWVKEQLGHQSINLTVDTYGRWGRTAQKKQAERLAEAFLV